ncbi:unnamed protein product [Didymodactylos carnosus]|uniref:MAM domain-containing protein n=1 Tax=Didymodactylos carnosus TaxID=1234261 RepID=A0A814RRF0_9BILA|nr:unnamed protein product [Didymodactylos carnosus]CAF3900112.1 unnamed protein product [Didymodactylos carnosus]
MFVCEPFQVVLEAIVGKGHAGDIAVDDTSFTPECSLGNVGLVTVTTQPTTITPNPCQPNEFLCIENRQCINGTLVCDFKKDCLNGSDEAACGTCNFDQQQRYGWRSVGFLEYDWTLGTGKAPSGQCPDADHMENNGYYLLVDGTMSDSEDYKSIQSPVLGPSGIECQLKFWYYINGNTDYSAIDVFLHRLVNGTDIHDFLQWFDEEAPEWQQAVVNIGHQADRFSVEIDGFPGDASDIAIDDVGFFNCQTTTPILDLPIDCTFEHDWCNYFRDDTADFQSDRVNHTTYSAETGPGFDSEFYYLIRQENDKARSLSAIQNPSTGQPRCLSFWYHMYGLDIGTLNVYVDSVSPTDFSRKLIWQKSSSQGNQWLHGTKTLQDISDGDASVFGCRIVFEDVVGKDYLGDISLDGIFVSNNQCPSTKTCDFEVDMCDFKASPEKSWIRQQASNMSNFVNMDHTTSTSLGSFALTKELQSSK